MKHALEINEKEIESLLAYIDQTVEEKELDEFKVNFLLSEGLWMAGVIRASGSTKHLHILLEIVIYHFTEIIKGSK